MSSSLYKITEHVVAGQHIRGYPNGTKRRQEDTLKIGLKQYTPLDNPVPQEGAITIVAAHAIGVPKECYEPLWDELLALSRTHGFAIRNIWMADMCNHGASGVLNEDVQGDGPDYFDHSRDMLCIINQFRDQMSRPLIGVAHSMGSIQLTMLSVFHPRLFSRLIFIEPTLMKDAPRGPNAAMYTSYRADIWPSISAATTALQKNKFYSTWDRRALNLYLQHGLRPTPTAIYPFSPSVPAGSMTLTTPKSQEAWTFIQSYFAPQDTNEKGERVITEEDRILHPERMEEHMQYVFTRAEPGMGMHFAAYLRPPVLYVFGSNSYINPPHLCEQKINETGTAPWGSGGVAKGQVHSVVLENSSHMLPCEDVGVCAGVVAGWLGAEMRVWAKEEALLRGYDDGKSEGGERLVLSERWMKGMKEKAYVKRPLKERGREKEKL